MKLKGLFTAIITPFKKDYSLDLDGFLQNIEYQMNAGVDGLILLGTTGESTTLSLDEKILLIREAVKFTNGRIHLMVGTGTNDTATTIKNTQLAKDLGADSALIICPYYNKPNQEGLNAHFAKISQEVHFPICLYNNPGRTHVNLHSSTLAKLIEIPEIIGIKEASGNMAQIMDFLQIIEKRQDFSLLCGDDLLTYSTISLGADGVISVASNIITQEMKELVRSLLEGDYFTARQRHFKNLALLKALFIDTNPIPLKAAMNLLDMPAGPCRLPLTDLNPELLKILKNELNHLNHALKLSRI